MPVSKFERAVFGGMMALAMVYGMEVYNHALRSETLSDSALCVAVDEMIVLTIIVMLQQELVGGPLARRLALRVVDWRTARPALLTLPSRCSPWSACAR